MEGYGQFFVKLALVERQRNVLLHQHAVVGRFVGNVFDELDEVVSNCAVRFHAQRHEEGVFFSSKGTVFGNLLLGGLV